GSKAGRPLGLPTSDPVRSRMARRVRGNPGATSVKTLGRTAISGSPSDLLPPCAETMVALAEALGTGIAAPPLRDLLLRDPGALVVFLSPSADTPSESAVSTASLANSRLALPLWTAMQMSSHDGRFADWSRPGAARAYRFSQATATIARSLVIS